MKKKKKVPWQSISNMTVMMERNHLHTNISQTLLHGGHIEAVKQQVQ